MKRVLITIPTFNAERHVRSCIQSIQRALAFAADNNFHTEIAVIDDCSTDMTASLLSAFPEVKLIRGTGELWWSGSINRGVAYALETGVDYVMLLNVDNTVPEDFFAKSYEALLKRPEAILGSRVLDTNGKVYFQGCSIDGMGQLRYLQNEPGTFTRCEVFGGMGVFIPARVFAELGLFDERNFPLYFGDTDFWLRCKRAGIPAFIGPGMELVADLGNTGLKKSSKGTLFILKNLFNIRFHANLKTVGRFYFKNFNLPRSLAAFFLFYLNSVRTGK